MKRLKKLKLNNLEQGLLNEQEMNILRGGGDTCNCGCGYAGQPGGASSSQNASANKAAGHPHSYGYDNDANTSIGYPCTMEINDNWSCIGSVNCNNEPNKC